MIGLILLFSSAVAASLLWLGGVLFYTYAKIGFPHLFGMALPDLAMISATAFLPIIFLWMVVGLLYNVMTLKKQGNTINLLLTQTRRSADHAEAMVRTLMETQLQSRSAMVLQNADLFINELNDLLADITVRFGLMQPVHTEIVWQRVGDGNRWAFCKVVLQNAENSPKFQDDLKEQLRRDRILSHAVRTFCYRFEQMFTMLERHDIEHYLTKIFEEGAMGRVYLRFVEACRAVDKPVETPVQNADMTAGMTYSRSETGTEQVYEEPEYAKEMQMYEEVENAYEIPQYEQPVQYADAAAYAANVHETQAFQEENAQEQSPEPTSVRPKQAETSSPFGFLRPTR